MKVNPLCLSIYRDSNIYIIGENERLLILCCYENQLNRLYFEIGIYKKKGNLFKNTVSSKKDCLIMNNKYQHSECL
jgi:hypothetical protein